MARGDNLRQSELMIRAEESGQSARARAHENLMAEGKYTSESFQRMGQQAGQNIQQHEEFKEGQHQFDVKDFRAKQGLQLEGAKAGFDMGSEQEPQRGGKTAKGPQSERERKLAEDMERGAGQPSVGSLDPAAQERLKSQTSKPIEDTGSRMRPGWVQNEQGKRMQEVKEFDVKTDRINAEVARDNVGLRAQEAAAKGDVEEYKTQVDISAKHVNGLVSKFDKLMNAANGMGKEDFSNEDWSDLKKMAGETGMEDPKLQEAIASKDASNPRVQQFLRAQISKEAIKHIFRTGDSGSIKVDWTAPKMREFKQSVDYFNDLAQSMGPGFARFAQINSIESKMRFLNQQAALAVMMGMTGADASARFDKTGEGFVTGQEEQAMRGSGDAYAGFDEGAPRQPDATLPSSPKGEPATPPEEEKKLSRWIEPGRPPIPMSEQRAMQRGYGYQKPRQ